MRLFIARTIVEVHNGQQRAENQFDGGARFRIRLPLKGIAGGPHF
jgi:signal transduction histidine kinase